MARDAVGPSQRHVLSRRVLTKPVCVKKTSEGSITSSVAGKCNKIGDKLVILFFIPSESEAPVKTLF